MSKTSSTKFADVQGYAMGSIHIFAWRLWLGIAALLLLSQPASRGEEDAVSSAKQKEEEARRRAEEKEIKALFGFSFADIQDSLVIVSCQNDRGSSEGTGFIAQMDGAPYLLTSKNYLMGADKITFKTVGGKRLRPRGIEFSANRNLARFPLEDETGLEIGTQKSIGMPIAVFGNSEGSGVITELYGKVSEVGSSKFEVSANFVTGNNGSPVLGTNMQVVGMASHVSLIRQKKTTESEDKKKKKDEDEDEGEDDDSYKTRHFCIPLSGNQWVSINWKQYNRKYGKPYRKNERTFSPILSAVQQWIKNPYATISIGKYSDSDIDEWLELHNGMANRLVIFSKNKSVTSWQLRSANNDIKNNLTQSAEMLSEICGKYKRKISFLSNSREPTGFVQKEYERHAEYLGHAETALPFIAEIVLGTDFFRFKQD